MKTSENHAIEASCWEQTCLNDGFMAHLNKVVPVRVAREYIHTICEKPGENPIEI
jgi:hypothetical protein